MCNYWQMSIVSLFHKNKSIDEITSNLKPISLNEKKYKIITLFNGEEIVFISSFKCNNLDLFLSDFDTMKYEYTQYTVSENMNYHDVIVETANRLNKYASIHDGLYPKYNGKYPYEIYVRLKDLDLVCGSNDTTTCEK